MNIGKRTGKRCDDCARSRKRLADAVKRLQLKRAAQIAAEGAAKIVRDLNKPGQ